MMQLNGLLDQRRERMAGQHSHADVGVGLDDRVFLLAQALGLAQNRIRYADLAQVVQKAAQRHARRLGITEIRLLGQEPGITRNPPEMAPGVGVSRLHEPRHHEQACQQGVGRCFNGCLVLEP
jgi:hypothetical protein